MNMIHEAIIFSAVAHKNQKRKGTDVPYIVHPFEVAQILTQANASESAICAGLLHDTVEDTEVTLEDIRREFGQETAEIVASMTEDKSLSWEERKQKTIDTAGSMSLEKQQLLCADKLSSLRSIDADMREVGEDIWKRFKRGKESQKWYYKGIMEALSHSLHNYAMYQEMKELFNKIFSN